MSLKFVFGPSGSGKSYQLYDYVIRESVKFPDRQYIVLVPEQFTMQTQKDLVMQHPNHGIMNIDVLSFVRLAYRIFEETGGQALPVLDDEGKNLILRKIAGDYEKDLKVLKGNMKKLGYISEVKSVLSEFDQYDIGEEELRQMKAAAGENSRLYYKLQDLEVLYIGFKKYLEDRFITKEELLDALCRVVKGSDILKESTIVLDGFTGFTPVQNRLLGELLEVCREVIVTVTMDDRENPYVYKHPYQLFALGKHTVTSLIQIAAERKVSVEDPLCLYERPLYRFCDNSAMEFLERNIFRYSKECYKERQGAVQVHVARNPREEAMKAAGRVRNLVRTKGYRYRDIGVIVSNMEVYGDDLGQAFDLYEIPVFMDHKRSILLNSFVEYIRSLLNMVKDNFSYESVFRFLRTNLSGFTYGEVDELENYVIALGIRGYKKWQESWIRRPKYMEEENLEILNHNRVRLVEKVDTLVYVLRQRSKTVKDVTMALYEFMVREELQLKLQRQSEAFQEAGELALAKEYSQVYRILIELFDKFVELLGDEKVTMDEYLKLLDAGLEEARVGVIPPGIDQVVVGDMQRTRLKDMKALIFVGANDTFLPGALIRSGLLTERDRDKFATGKIHLSPGGKEKAYEQKFYLYMNLTKPSETLDIYYSKVSADGKSIRPSYLIQEMQRLFSGLEIEDEEKQAFSAQEWTPRLGMQKVIRGFQDGNAMDQEWQELYSWYKRQPQWQYRVEELMKSGFYTRPADGLTKEVAKQLYGEHFQDSITRIERFSACAFAHFLTYGLRLRERQTYEFQPLDLGNVCHSALEYYSRKLKEEHLSWTEIEEEKRQEYIDDSVEHAISDYGNSVLYSSARNEYMIERMKRLLTRTIWALTKQLEAGDFVPVAYEMRFENGKIDRVDLCKDKDKVYVKVLDYKTGSKAFDVVALYHGLQLQLMVYMDAAVKMTQKHYPDSEVIPAGVFYYRLNDPLVEKKVVGEEEEIWQKVLKELKVDGVMNLKDETLEHLDHCQAGESAVIPVKYNKNGSLSKNSKVASEQEFEVMMRHALGKVFKVHQKILSGEVAAFPYRRKQESGCDYCAYRHICGFDQKIPGYKYRDIFEMTQSEVIAAMEADAVKENMNRDDHEKEQEKGTGSWE